MWEPASPLTVNLVCGAAHFVGTAYIAAVPWAYDVPYANFTYAVSRSFYENRPWEVRCNGVLLNTTTANCSDANTTFRIVQPVGDEIFSSVNLLGLAIAFSAVSCAVHFALACGPTADTVRNRVAVNTTRLVVDYGVSAPIMLALINTLWGANNLAGVIAAPVLLGVLLVLSAGLLATVVYGTADASVYALFAVLCALFVVSLLPTVAAVWYSVMPKDDVSEGQAPAFVAVFSAIVLVTFSSFLWPYWKQLRNEGRGEDGLYGVLSITAKWSLHMLLTFGMITQIKLTGEDEAEANPLQSGLIAVAVVGTFGGLLGAVFQPWSCCRATRKTGADRFFPPTILGGSI